MVHTGAAYKRGLNQARTAHEIPVQGSITSMFANIVPEAFHLRVGERKLKVDPVIAVDLSPASITISR